MSATANWDLTPFFSAPASADYTAFVGALRADIASLEAGTRELPPLTHGSTASWARHLVRIEDVDARLSHLLTYLGCQGAADSRDEWTQRETASQASTKAALEKVFVAVKAKLAAASTDVFQSLLECEELVPVAHFIDRLRIKATHSMDAELEALAADLGVDGIEAWSRLYDQISGNLEFELEVPGQAPRKVPVAMTRSLLESPDADVRAAALAGANRAWESVSDSVAACLNAISGTRLSLYARRGIEHFLEPALFDAGISAETLDAMLAAVESRRQVAWSYYRLKARALGMERLRFCDTMAPFPSDRDVSLTWDEAKRTVLDSFGSFYPALRELAQTAFDARWIDHDPRAGKRPGGFCATSPVLQESRIFMTFNQTSGDMQTLAHELGHAFHGAVMRNMRYWATLYPMTLAETASTFGEALVTDALLARDELTPRARLALLDGKLSDAATFLCNTPMRFVFERALYEERKTGEVPASRLCELMTQAARECYGDSLRPDSLDPWFWASKLHFYITDVSFYNFPYTFGFLFSNGIFARAKKEGSAFLATYERLLRLTGSASAETVARETLGIDITRPDFWNESIDLIEADLAAYEEELGRLLG